MELIERIEKALEAAFEPAQSANTPPRVLQAMRHAVFPGGARVRPSLCQAVASACGNSSPAVTDAAASAIELLHCASLVHDDLPCFDDADIRRCRASVHSEFGEALAVLAGDGLIILAFDTLVRAASADPDRVLKVLDVVIKGVGLPNGIVAGQAWESEPTVSEELYRQSKTGALFVAATTSGALSAGADPDPWRKLGEKVGEAYQVADDLLDAVTREGQSDKPVGRDAALNRPSAVAELGVSGARDRLKALVDEAVAAVPECDHADSLRELVRTQSERLVPSVLRQSAA